MSLTFTVRALFFLSILSLSSFPLFFLSLLSLSSFSLSFHSAAASEPVTTAVVGSVTNPTSYVCTAYVCEQQCKPQRTTNHPRSICVSVKMFVNSSASLRGPPSTPASSCLKPSLCSLVLCCLCASCPCPPPAALWGICWQRSLPCGSGGCGSGLRV